MEKKKYIAPEMEIMDIETVEMIASSLLLNENGGNEESLSNRYRSGRRGTWGNLWAKDEEQ